MASGCCSQPVPLTFNCGYARAAIYHITNELTGNKGRKGVCLETRATKFKTLFQGCANYGIPDGYFGNNTPTSTFNRHCSSVLDAFKAKWYPQQARSDYLSIFSPTKWEHLSANTKAQHTLGNCDGCCQNYFDWQGIPR